MDIQPVFNQYKAILYVCSYFAKSEDQCSEAMKEAAKLAIENKLDNSQAMKMVIRAYLSKRECSVQEAVYHILPELHLRKIFPGVCFANSNLPEERTKILLTEEEMNLLPEESTDIFRRNNLDRYMDRPDQSCGKFSILDSFCFAEFLAQYTLISKPKDEDIVDEYQPDILPDEVIEENHALCGYPKTIKLMSSNEKMRCRKVRRVLRYHVPNKHRFPEKYAHHLLFLFYPFRSENELLAGNPPSYQSKLCEASVLEVVNSNKQKFEPFADIVDEAFANYNENLVNNQDPYGQIDNDETEQTCEDTDENESNSSDTSVNNALPNNMPPQLSDESISENIRTLNVKQRHIFNIVHKWARDYIKGLNTKGDFEVAAISYISLRKWWYWEVSCNQDNLPGSHKNFIVSCN